MTGYGQATAEAAGVRLTVEARSVNHRFAEVRIRLPEGLLALERDLRGRALARVHRGRVEVTVAALPATPSGTIALNEPLLRAVLEALERLRGALPGGLPPAVDPAALLSVPGMFTTTFADPGWLDASAPAVCKAFESALEALDADRAREGGMLVADLEQRVAELERLSRRIGELVRVAPEAVRARLLERLRLLGSDVQLDPARVAQEALLLADRSDASEEFVRLEGHLGQLRELLRGDSGDPVGKRIEFLVQEMQREANTLASKAAQLELTRAVLAVKAELEKIREQVSNLE